MVGSDSRYADATHLTLRRYQVKKQSVHVNSLILRHDQMNVKLENNYHIPDLVQAFPKTIVGQTSIYVEYKRKT